MEALYSKLYDKYTKLKTKKLSETFDELNKEQEVKFMNCVTAAEDLIQHLKCENDQLHGQVKDLRSELVSVRLEKDKQVADYQRLLLEASKKNEVLTEEVEKLVKLHQERTSADLNNNRTVMAKDDQYKAISNSSSIRMTRKRSRQEALENEARLISYENCEGDSVVGELADSAQNLCKETASGKLPECSTEANEQTGVGSPERDHFNWLIQTLFEYALGMKLSTDHRNGRLRLSALHQSSGYSFRLTWISRAPGEEADLLYQVLSLGTLERVAIEWMKEDILFSTNMFFKFFEMVSGVIRLNP